jgi:hypothetical protein
MLLTKSEEYIMSTAALNKLVCSFSADAGFTFSITIQTDRPYDPRAEMTVDRIQANHSIVDFIT